VAKVTIDQAVQQVEQFARAWPVFDATRQIALEAVWGVRDHQFSFWDARIWGVACLNQVELVFSEEFNPGAVIEGVQFVNPFADDFELETWGL
jgi:predicted nucleic acid-binding protein